MAEEGMYIGVIFCFERLFGVSKRKKALEREGEAHFLVF